MCKSLRRTVPKAHRGDDSVVHEDVSPDTVMEYIDPDKHPKKCVCMACYQARELDDTGLCVECAKKLKKDGKIDLGGGVV